MPRPATLHSTPSFSRSVLRLRLSPTLGGLAFGLTYSRPEPTIEAVSGAPAIKSATLIIGRVDYESDAPSPDSGTSAGGDDDGASLWFERAPAHEA